MNRRNFGLGVLQSFIGQGLGIALFGGAVMLYSHFSDDNKKQPKISDYTKRRNIAVNEYKMNQEETVEVPLIITKLMSEKEQNILRSYKSDTLQIANAPGQTVTTIVFYKNSVPYTTKKQAGDQRGAVTKDGVILKY